MPIPLPTGFDLQADPTQVANICATALSHVTQKLIHEACRLDSDGSTDLAFEASRRATRFERAVHACRRAAR